MFMLLNEMFWIVRSGRRSRYRVLFGYEKA